MSEKTDKRNCKCFFGMHQFSILEKRQHRQDLDFGRYQSTSHSINIISSCDFCGKIKHNKIHL